MEVAVEATGGLERRMTVQVPEEAVSAQVDERLRDMVRSARVPGFRPGKVPLKVITRRYGKKVREEVVGELVQSSFYDAITREELRPAGGPIIDPLQAEPGQGLSYTAVFEVYPKLDISTVDGMQIERPVAEVEDADVEKMIETLRRQRREFDEVERPAADGDRVTVSFEGSIDGVPFEGGKAEEMPVELGSSGMIDGFEEGITGLSAGESGTVEVTFPAEYRAEQLAGKQASFAITVHKVEAMRLPEIDEDFVKTFGVGDGTVESFRAEVRQNMQRELRERLRSRTKEAVMDQLLETNAVELPSALVREEQQRLLQNRSEELRQQGYDPESLGLGADAFEAHARRRVALGLLLAEIIRSNGLQADQARVREVVESIASTFEQPEQVIAYYYGDRNRLAEVESSVLEDQVVELLLERASVSDRVTTFDALMNPGQTEPAA